MNVRMPLPEEFGRTDELFALAFEMPMKRAEAREPDDALHWAAFDDDGEMMSTLTVSDFSVQFDGYPCRMGGIGGVATLPQYRRRGGIRGCFHAFLPELSRRGYDFSYLYPFSSCFYRQFGYENCVQRQAVTIDLKQLKVDSFTGTFRLAEPGRDLAAAVKAIDSGWENTFNMAVRHHESNYRWVTKSDPAATQEFCYVWFREDGTPGAYTVYHLENQPDGRNLICKFFRFSDRHGFRALLNLFCSLATDHKYLKFELPDHAALRYLMSEWSLGAVSWSTVCAGMVRVIRVKEVLKKARYRGSGQVVLKIHDPQIAENNGCFHVVFEDGKAVSVHKADVSADVELDISAFSALIVGVCDFCDAARWMDGIQVFHCSDLDRVFYRKPLYISDYF